MNMLTRDGWEADVWTGERGADGRRTGRRADEGQMESGQAGGGKRAGTLGRRADGGAQWANKRRGAMAKGSDESGIQAMEVSEVVRSFKVFVTKCLATKMLWKKQKIFPHKEAPAREFFCICPTRGHTAPLIVERRDTLFFFSFFKV